MKWNSGRLEQIDLFILIVFCISDSQCLWSHHICRCFQCWCTVWCRDPDRLSSTGLEWVRAPECCPLFQSYCFYTPPSAYWSEDGHHSIEREISQTFWRITSQIRHQTVAASTHPGALDLLINFIEFQSVIHVSHSSLDRVDLWRSRTATAEVKS